MSSPYAKTFAELSDADPRHVEAWVRLARPTLNGLSKEELAIEVRVAEGCIAAVGQQRSEELAVSFGL